MVKIVVKVEVVPYNEDWPRKYALEANVIRNIVLDELITITHVVGRTGFQVDVFIIKAMVQSMFMHLMKEVMIKLNC